MGSTAVLGAQSDRASNISYGAPTPMQPAPRSSRSARPLRRKAGTAGMGYERRLAVGEPLASLLAGAAPSSWATAELACDSPDKKSVARGERAGAQGFKVRALALAGGSRAVRRIF